MKKRWLAIALVAWVNLITLFSYALVPAPAAQAAGTYHFTDPNTITNPSGGSGGITLTYVYTGSGNTYIATLGFCDIRTQTQPAKYTITLGSKNANGSYSATVSSSCGGTSNITVTNPNNVTPASSSNGGAGGGTTGGNTVDKPDCDAGAAISWLICDIIIHPMLSLVDTIRDKVIVPFLKEPPLDKNDTADGIDKIYTVWAAFRNVASVFFILIFFVIVFGTALGMDNYTVKKTMPRLVAGAILVPFSWYICAIGVDIGNVVGQGLLALTASVIPKSPISFNNSLSDVFFLGTTGLLVAAGVTAAFTTLSAGVIITMVLGFLTVLFTLILRKILIMLMIVISPFALLAWILPNTEKWFKEWYNNFSKLILMYPLILMLFEIGRLFAVVANAGGIGVGGSWDPLFALLGLIMPLFLVPMTFSMAGKGMKMGAGAIGKASSFADKKWGKDSADAKARHDRFQNRRAATAADITKGGFARAMARKQSGTGGLILGGGALSSVKGFRGIAGQRADQKNQMREMAGKHRALIGSAEGIDETEQNLLAAARTLPEGSPEREQALEALSARGRLATAKEAAGHRYIGEISEAQALIQSKTQLGETDTLGTSTDAVALASQTNLSAIKEQAKRVEEAGQQMMTGVDKAGITRTVKISDAATYGLDSALDTVARDAAANGDHATMMAAMQTLGKWGGGQLKLDQIRKDLFAGNDDQLVDGTRFNGNGIGFWKQATDGIQGAPHLTTRPSTAFANAKDTEVASWKHATVGEYTRWAARQGGAEATQAAQILATGLHNDRIRWDGDQLDRIADAYNSTDPAMAAYKTNPTLKAELNKRLAAAGKTLVV